MTIHDENVAEKLGVLTGVGLAEPDDTILPEFRHEILAIPVNLFSVIKTTRYSFTKMNGFRITAICS
jgi:hypothetical protein